MWLAVALADLGCLAGWLAGYGFGSLRLFVKSLHREGYTHGVHSGVAPVLHSDS